VSLTGLTIVVTRPRDSAEATARALVAAGASAIALPLLEISAVEAAPSGLAAVPDAIIFVSSHAAEFGVPALSRQRLIANVGAAQSIYAVGRATAKRLAGLGLSNVHTPSLGEDSEALLAEPAFSAPTGKTVLIVKGDSEGGGRQLIAETLVARGATVADFICYRRQPVALGVAEASQLRAAVVAGAWVLVGSIETLESLQNALAASQLVMADVAKLLVPHPRVADAARAAGARQVSVVSLEDNKLVESLSNMSA
jgi:uroporphyrinogen-III synthase